MFVNTDARASHFVLNGAYSPRPTKMSIRFEAELLNKTLNETTASGCGARVSACAGLINQLQRCRFDSRIACLENPDTAIVGDWWTEVGGRHALNC